MPSDLHIGMVSVDSPPHIGGIGRHVGSLVEGLRASGVSVSVFDRSQRPLTYRFGRNVGFSAGLSRALLPWISAEKIDLLHVHAGPGGVFLPSAPIPMIVTANHTYAQQSRLPWQRWKSVFTSAERMTYLSAHAVVCISEDTADSIRQDYGIARARVCTIPCGFDLRPWHEKDAEKRDRKSCVFVGRADTRKGFDLLLEAWRMVHASDPEAVLSVAGVSGTDQPGIRYLGRIGDDRLHTLVGSARMLIAPSRMEGFGLAAAEAIAAGTPVVATDSAGLRCVVRDGVTGCLVSCDPASIAHMVGNLLRDDALWGHLHDGCRNGRIQFDRARETDAYRALYDEVYSAATCAIC